MFVNSIHEQCPNSELNSAQNSALHQIRSCALSAQRPGRAHNLRRSRAQRAQVARIALRSWAHVATSFPCPAQGQVATLFPSRDLLEASPCRDIKLVSRHYLGQSRSRPPGGVATPLLLPSPKPGRDTKTRSRPSWSFTYVATSNSCRDLIPAHNGTSRSRCQTLGLDLPHCCPCRDIKMMSRHQAAHPRSQHGFSCRDQGLLTHDLSQVATPKRMSRHQLLQSRSQSQTMSRPRPAWPRSRMRCPGRGRALALSCALLRVRAALPCAPACHDLESGSRPRAGIWQ